MTTNSFVPNRDDSELAKLEACLGYKFKDLTHLQIATTHSSFDSSFNYERYEFYGDALLSCIIAKYLMEAQEFLNEGNLTVIRSNLVCSETLAKIASNINLGDYIRLDKGEILNNGRERRALLEDTMEALFAAIYLDCNDFQTLERVILNLYRDYLGKPITSKENVRDAKSTLQEILQDRFKQKPSYEIICQIGKPHEQLFIAKCRVLPLEDVTYGIGKSKQVAMQNSAFKMINALYNRNAIIDEKQREIALRSIERCVDQYNLDRDLHLDGHFINLDAIVTAQEALYQAKQQAGLGDSDRPDLEIDAGICRQLNQLVAELGIDA